MNLDKDLEETPLDAVELSEKRLLLESWETDNGYSADADTSSAGSLSSSSEIDGSHIEFEISYLRKKQSILTRAIIAMKSEETYNASKARNFLNANDDSKMPSIWTEAKEIIQVLKGRKHKKEETEETIEKRVRICEEMKGKKRQRIDLSTVTSMTANSFIENDGNDPNVGKRAISKSMSFNCAGPWMIQALTNCIRLQTSNQDPTRTFFGDLQVVDDPDVGLLVIPPHQLPFQNGISLMNALSFTSVAQLITLSTPPFCVVHANRAFSLFSGLSSKDLIGKPVEEILQIAQDTMVRSTSSSKKNHALKSIITSSRKPCKLLVSPVIDERGGCMSHLLIKMDSNEASVHVANNKRGDEPIQEKALAIG